jgi:uncharacterized protein
MKCTAIAIATLIGMVTATSAADLRPKDYVEFVVHDIAKSKAFYAGALGWTFTDYGPNYTSFSAASVGGGFTVDGTPQPGGPLMVFYAPDLDAALVRVTSVGGTIVKPPFTYPGGRRFHFRDPDGYEVAVWSEK